MKLAVFLRFSTKPGQKIKIKGNIPSLGSETLFPVPLQYYNADYWHLNVDLNENEISEIKEITYSYQFEDEWGNATEDWGLHRKIKIDKSINQLTLIDTWIDMGATENVYYTAPFRHTISSHISTKKLSLSKTKLNLSVKAPMIHPEDQLAVTGNCTSLGNWLSDGYTILQFDGDKWIGKIDLPYDQKDIEYKYVVLNKDGQLKHYEDGDNRKLILPAKQQLVTLIQDGYARLPHTWKGTGLAIPVFSLRSCRSLGVGEFNDIPLLVDWASSVSIKMIQLLPVNDTTSTYTYLDSYPYAAISAFALHPLYGSIEDIAGKDHRELIQDVLDQKNHLNSFSGVDYEAVMNLKWKAYRTLYAVLKNSVFKSKAYKEFYEENQQWLKAYAVFCYLRDLNGTTDFSVWKSEHQFSSDLVETLTDPKGKSFDHIGLHLFVQYFLHVQLKRAHEYANNRGIVLKGDIAIGVNKQSADTWVQPELYNLDQQAGAPPDDFAIKGQNWGFPTYNWKVMKQRGFDWWKLRFMQMSNYFDAFRIDHILGFFRIWSIPSHAVEGIMGKFVPAIPVHADELHAILHGTSLDRLCNPYITDEVLHELSQGRPELLHPFIYSTGNSSYAFKPEFSSQRLIEKHFQSGTNTDQQTVLQALYNLHSNVVLWRDEEDSNGFHFRFHAFKTISFQHLESDIQLALMQLYNAYFFHRQENIWEKEALDKLPDLKKCTEMLICGEDLGLVPSCVPEVMNSLGFLSMEVQRMPKQSNQSFFNPRYAPYLSVVTPSTHDMSTLREWWTENYGSSQLFYNEQLGQYGQAPQEATPSIIKGIIQQHLYSPAMWAIFQLQDLLAMSEKLRLKNPAEERINIPGDSKHYWRYRMPLLIEDLMREENFNSDLRNNINSSQR